MKNSQKPDHKSLATLLHWLKEGRFVIPDFQREFEWEAKDIRDLVRSIFLDYYIGSLLLLKGKKETFDALSCEPIYGYDVSEESDYIVLDGQQRLTAINYAFTAPDKPLPNRTGRAFFWIDVTRFMDGDYEEAFEYRWDSRNARRLFSDPQVQFEQHVFPCAIVGASSGYERYEWVRGYQEFWTRRADDLESADPTEAKHARKHAENGKRFGSQVDETINQYQISYNELDRDLDIAKVCDIFTQLNSKGVRLDIFDLMNALLKPRDLQLKHLWRSASERLQFVDTNKMNVYVLQVMSILAQDYCSPRYLYYLLPGQEKTIRLSDGSRRRETLVDDASDFLERWNIAVDALEDAITVLKHPHEYGAVAPRFFPYVSILPVFAALRDQLRRSPAHLHFSGRRKLRHWYWASVFDNRYSGAVESTSTQDYRDVQKWIHDDDKKPQLVEDFERRLSGLDLHNATNSASSVYKGVFNLLVLKGARDWNSGDIPPYDSVDDHHIVPASWGHDHLKPNEINSILNRTPLTAETNRHVIRDRLPNVYLRDLITQNGESAVRKIMEYHYISAAALQVLLRKPFSPEDYAEFLQERRIAILDAIQSQISDEMVDLSPALRQLDEDIQQIELGLRGLLVDTFENETNRLPGHVAARLWERIEKAALKNPIFDVVRYNTLAGMLEYADLRELQQVITSAPGWPAFQPLFVNKTTFDIKFDQLAELRNAIRHSRAVNEVIRKDGEAAIAWFKQLLRSATPALR